MQDVNTSGAEALDSLFAEDRDRGGNSAPPVEQMQPDAVEQPLEEAPPISEAQAQPVEEPRHVPLAELKKEREKRQDYERQLAEANDRARYYETQLQQWSRQQPQQQAQPSVPDPWVDPQGYIAHELQQRLEPVQFQMMNTVAHISEGNARRQFGDALCDEAANAAKRAGLNHQFMQTPDPWGAAVNWYRRAKTLQEVGDDPESYRKRIREEVLAELRAGGGTPANGQPRTQFPGSLASATSGGGAPQGGPVTQQAMMDQLFSSDRHAPRAR